jgi:hypothetical protein
MLAIVAILAVLSAVILVRFGGRLMEDIFYGSGGTLGG